MRLFAKGEGNTQGKKRSPGEAGAVGDKSGLGPVFQWARKDVEVVDKKTKEAGAKVRQTQPGWGRGRASG